MLVLIIIKIMGILQKNRSKKLDISTPFWYNIDVLKYIEKGGVKLARLIAKRNYNKTLSDKMKENRSIVGYRLSLTTKGIQTTGFTLDDELEIEYKKDKIIVTKKK